MEEDFPSLTGSARNKGWGGNVALEPVSLKDAHWRVGGRAGLHLLNALGLVIIPTRVDFVLIDVKKAYTGRR